MKIAINRSPINGPWGGGNNFVKAIYKSVPKGISLTNELSDDVNIILLIDPRKEGSFDANDAFKFASTKKSVQVIQRINECDSRKGTEHMDNLLLQCSRYNTKTIFVSEWMRNYFNSKGWTCQNQHTLINGVDDCFFEASKNSKKENNGLINVVTHHWSNNILKGFDVYDFIDYLTTKNDNISFTYIGRERGTFKNCKVIPPLHGKSLAEELSKYDIYVSGSRNDPGPNHILESIAVGLPTYAHIEGGGAAEFVGKQHIYRNFSELENIIQSYKFEKNKNNVSTWSESMLRFWNIIQN